MQLAQGGGQRAHRGSTGNAGAAEAELAAADADAGAEQHRCTGGAGCGHQHHRHHGGGECGAWCTTAREFAEALQQAFAHQGTCTRQALAHGRIAEPEQVGDLLRALSFAVVQQQDFAAVSGQGGDDVLGGDLLFHPLQAISRTWGRVGGHAHRHLRGLAGQRPATLRTQPVAGQVAGDLPQPRQEAGRAAQLVQLLPALHEGLLGDVLAGLAVAGDGQGDGGDRVLAGQHDTAVGVLATAGGGGQFAFQGLVDRCGERRHGGGSPAGIVSHDGAARPM